MTEAAATEETGYIKTTTHNFVSRQAKIDGAKQVEIKGRSILEEGVHVRGDLHIVRIGRYCDIGRNTILEPPLNPLMKNASEYKQKYIPMAIGSHTKIGENCEVYAAAIGSMVWIGDNVKIGKRCIIKDNCIIENGVVLGDDTVIPPFTRISTKNPTLYHELPPSMAVQMQERSLDRYAEFKETQRTKQ